MDHGRSLEEVLSLSLAYEAGLSFLARVPLVWYKRGLCHSDPCPHVLELLMVLCNVMCRCSICTFIVMQFLLPLCNSSVLLLLLYFSEQSSLAVENCKAEKKGEGFTPRFLCFFFCYMLAEYFYLPPSHHSIVKLPHFLLGHLAGFCY